MVERICPTCQHGNPLENRFCGTCGTPLERQLPAQRPDNQLQWLGRNLPITWQQLGKTVAISVAALVAEAGLAWLRHQIDNPARTTPTSLARLMRQNPPTTNSTQPGNAVTIVSQRTIEIQDRGNGSGRIIERHFWRRTED